jgi:hypothetical protein
MKNRSERIIRDVNPILTFRAPPDIQAILKEIKRKRLAKNRSQAICLAVRCTVKTYELESMAV